MLKITVQLLAVNIGYVWQKLVEDVRDRDSEFLLEKNDFKKDDIVSWWYLAFGILMMVVDGSCRYDGVEYVCQSNYSQMNKN